MVYMVTQDNRAMDYDTTDYIHLAIDLSDYFDRYDENWDTDDIAYLYKILSSMKAGNVFRHLDITVKAF